MHQGRPGSHFENCGSSETVFVNPGKSASTFHGIVVMQKKTFIVDLPTCLEHSPLLTTKRRTHLAEIKSSVSVEIRPSGTLL